MIARFAGAGLGFLAFTITAFAGLFAQNPVTVTLSRSILALAVFSLIGFVVGAAAELVVGEYESNRESEIRERFHGESAEPSEDGSGKESNEEDGVPIGT